VRFETHRYESNGVCRPEPRWGSLQETPKVDLGEGNREGEMERAIGKEREGKGKEKKGMRGGRMEIGSIRPKAH